MWTLQSEQNDKRVYVNSATGSRCTTSKVYTDNQGNNWWSFEDLMTIPYTRQFAATKISTLYALGLTKDDLTTHITGLKNILNSEDKEKYQKAYANVLEFESKTQQAIDPIKQLSSLVCVYYMLSDELIDSFDNTTQVRKLGILEADPKAHSFFLNRQMQDIETYTQHLNKISQIALPELPEK